MTKDEPARRQSGEISGPVRHLLHLVRLCKKSAGAIATDDHATMDEIEHSLAVAETATFRLLVTMASADSDGIVDVDDF